MRSTNWARRLSGRLAVGLAVGSSVLGLALRAAEPLPTAGAGSPPLAEPVRSPIATADRRAAEGEPDASRKRTDEFVQRFMSRRERLGTSGGVSGSSSGRVNAPATGATLTSPAAPPSSSDRSTLTPSLSIAAPSASTPATNPAPADASPARLATRLKLVDGPPASTAGGNASAGGASSGAAAAPPSSAVAAPATSANPYPTTNASPAQSTLQVAPGATSRRGAQSSRSAGPAEGSPIAASPSEPPAPTASNGPARPATPVASPPSRSAESTSEGDSLPGTGSKLATTRRASGGALSQLTIERSGPSELSVGEPANYKLTIRNTGSTPVDHVHLEVLLPAKSYALPDDGGRRERLAWKLGTINPGSTVSVPVSFLCREAGEAKLETWLFSPSIERSAIKVVEPTLLVELTPSSELRVGQSATLKLTVRNTGKGVARDVKLALELPDTLRRANDSTEPLAIGELAAGEAMRLEVPVQVVAPGPASARTTVMAAGGVELSSQHPVDVLAPKVKLSTSGVAVQNVGEIELYSAEIVNDGTAPLEWVTVVATLDRGLLLVDAEAGAEIDPGMRLLGWEVEKLAPGASKTLRWWAVAQRPGEGRQQVFVEAEGGVKAETTITTDLRLAAAVGLQVSEREATTSVGGEVIYQVRLFNHSEVVGEELVLTCELPEGLEPVTMPSAGERAWKGRVATFGPLAPLAPGEHRVFQVRARAAKPGWHTLRLLLSQGSGGPIVAEASEETRVFGPGESPAARDDRSTIPDAPAPPGANATND